MKIILLSDLHGNLPNLDTRDIDGVIIAGDICPDYIIPQQEWWFQKVFKKWLFSLPDTIYIPGNHDFCMEKHPSYTKVYYLGDALVYGFPHTNCPGWAFHAEEEKISNLLLTAPSFSDIVVCHNPPFGICDRADGYDPDNWHIGSAAIKKYLDIVRPKLCVFGHCHEGYGSVMYNDTLCINASYVDRRYVPRNQYLVCDTNNVSLSVIPC